jgi:hypothetical protein
MIPRSRSNKILHKRPGGHGDSASLASRCVGEVIRSVRASQRQSLWLSSQRMVAEVAAAFLITQADFMNRLLGTTQLTAAQWGFAFLAAVVLLLGWEAGKWIARRRAQAKHAITPAP